MTLFRLSTTPRDAKSHGNLVFYNVTRWRARLVPIDEAKKAYHDTYVKCQPDRHG